MELDLNQIEVRILGSLIEKEITTPEYYPLSLNSLIAACNQKTNRDPIMQLDESEAAQVLDSLKDKRLVWQLSTAGGRVPKFEHNFRSFFKLSDAETAVICVLLLRGPQTVGEIKSRTDRLFQFSSLEEVEKTIQKLSVHPSGPFVTEILRQSGQKEKRYMHLFSSEMVNAINASSEPVSTELKKTKPEDERFALLENQISVLQQELNTLKNDFETFKKLLE
jgi:uncharacterized protein